VHVGDASGWDADITVGNRLARNHVSLLARCRAADALFPQLLGLVKLWCRRRGLDQLAGRKTSSFAFTLLVIAFLQAEGRLPRNIASCDSPAAPASATESAGPKKEVEEKQQFVAEGRDAAVMATLLAGFFRFGALTDWSKYACSVGQGGIVRREELEGCGCGDWTGMDAMAIVDPEDGRYNVASHVTPRALSVIKAEMCRGFSLMRDACCLLESTMRTSPVYSLRKKAAL
jgi:DNA polymerase sigma